ncbi:MAG TPA: hypothetical protein DIV46_13460 [Verrucomicrobiales bacterium]|nr:hypothetical protein [Verrucomicrobiales bacterium]|tara:strand:+ start:1459 stop:1953 length:495 start_codon:yes stop_codon:yes gene_type:complete
MVMKISILYFILCCLAPSLRAEDPGMKSIGAMNVQLFFATNEDPAAAGGIAKVVSETELKNLRGIKGLDFEHYRLMGSDMPDILKGYENWATPLLPSKEILVSFQPIRKSGDRKLQMVLEYWQSKRKVFSVNPILTKGKTLYFIGPEWRKGRLILGVKIEKLTE